MKYAPLTLQAASSLLVLVGEEYLFNWQKIAVNIIDFVERGVREDTERPRHAPFMPDWERVCSLSRMGKLRALYLEHLERGLSGILVYNKELEPQLFLRPLIKEGGSRPKYGFRVIHSASENFELGTVL